MASDSVFKGRLGSTSRRSFMIAADDGTTHPVELLESIDVSEDPRLLEDVRSGRAYEIEHPIDGRRISLAHPLVLHDPTRRVLALLLPDALRHESLERRAQLLSELAKSDEPLPVYATQPRVVFSLEQFDALKAESNTESSTDLETSKELARQRAALQSDREKLEVERNQLDDVRERFDRERARMDEIESNLQTERESLEAERAELERERAALRAEELNLEQKQIASAQGTDFKPHASDATQVVTDDQFIEVMGDDGSDSDSVGDDDSIEIAEGADEGLESISDADIEDVEVEDTRMTALTDGVPKKFDDVVSGDRDRALKLRDDDILAVFRGDKADIADLFDGDGPGFFVQLHSEAGYPVIAVAIVRTGDDETASARVVWPLDVADASDRMILDQLEKRTALRVGLYNQATDALLRAVDVEAPLEHNVTWIRTIAESRLANAKEEGVTFGDAVSEVLDPEFELIGSMRHNFTVDSFEDATSPAALKLAVGILGYWSTDDVFEHLVANRSFPLHHFRAIQERVVRRAVEAGVWLPESLRDHAVDTLKIASDSHSLAERLIANFAETSVSLRSNDLDPIAQWENWDALLVLGEETGVPADNDVVELAEASLKRAREFEELQQSGARKVPEAESTSISQAPEGMMDDDLIVAKTSDATGVTYFLPDDAVLDTFDDLETMDRGDLERLLQDPSGRLEAAQMLLERFGSEAAEKALTVADEMNAPEVAALAKFLETRAKGMEAELVRTVESGGPSSVYCAARGLAYARSSTAIPAILDAMADPDRRGDVRRLSAAVGVYGEKLVPELRRVVKRDGPDEPWVGLLREVERHASGTVDAFARDRSKPLREAAQKVKG